MVVVVLLLGVLLVGVALLWWLLVAVVREKRPPPWVPEDRTFVDPVSGDVKPFPSLNDAPTLDLTVVVPAYNEERRVGRMLDEAIAHLSASRWSWEVLVVDDGSRDRTADLVRERYSRVHGTDRVRVLQLSRNRGKGGAVRRGMVQGRGRMLLMADADGATRFADLDRLVPLLGQEGIVVGSRAHMQSDAVARRSLLRNVLMWGFHLAVRLVGVRGIRDTQCGFKLFARSSMAALFPTVHVERWAFDVEVLFLAQQLGIPLAEVAVNWTEVDGSKLDPLWATLEMLRDLLRIRIAYATGYWGVWRQ